jgi:hypothetical protein
MRKRRYLVLTSEGARHPFRQTLPQKLLNGLSERKAQHEKDVKLFLLSFSAFFVAIYSFIR